MLRIFKTIDDGSLKKLKNIETNTWIDLVEPNEEEIKEVVEKTDIPANLLIKLMDSDEIARIEKEDDATLIIIDVPYIINKNKYKTIPLGIICYKNYLVTIATKETEVLKDVIENRVKSVFTMKKSRFLLQILHHVATLYLKYLKEINLEIEAREKTLAKTTPNKYLLQLMHMQKSLVYFVTSLKSNEIILEKLEKGNLVPFYEEDISVLEDAIIENKQGIETSLIYREIIASMSETFSSIASNNLNEIMKFLAGITIVFSIPTMISSFIGMNVPMGQLAKNPYSFILIVSISMVSACIIAIILRKKDML